MNKLAREAMREDIPPVYRFVVKQFRSDPPSPFRSFFNVKLRHISFNVLLPDKPVVEIRSLLVVGKSDEKEAVHPYPISSSAPLHPER